MIRLTLQQDVRLRYVSGPPTRTAEDTAGELLAARAAFDLPSGESLYVEIAGRWRRIVWAKALTARYAVVDELLVLSVLMHLDAGETVEVKVEP